MPALVEDRIKFNRIGFPSFGDGTGIFIEASDDGDMARSRLSGRTSVRDAPTALILDDIPQEGSSVIAVSVRLVELVSS